MSFSSDCKVDGNLVTGVCAMAERSIFSSLTPQGLVIKHMAPSIMVSSISEDWEEVVYINTGICLKFSCCLMIFKHSLPSMRGMLMSKNMREGN